MSYIFANTQEERNRDERDNRWFGIFVLFRMNHFDSNVTFTKADERYIDITISDANSVRRSIL